MKIRCLLVDDEPHALAVLRAHIAMVPMLDVVGQCQNAIAAFEVLQQQPVDLLFLDIKMPKLLGTDFLKTLRNPPRVIFTTAYRDYALEAFELDAIDYLLKPVSLERFIKAIGKVYSLENTAPTALPPVETLPTSHEAFLYFRVDRKMVKVFQKDILYIESLKDYVRIVTTARQLVAKQTITSLEEMLPEEKFLRIHRSYIISADKIESYTPQHLYIAGKELPIGRNYKHELVKALKLTLE
ncbi:LytTR family DNA-binding domain-containing protein [Rhodocytophaga aerolata]|uniref:LytTR family DNA-binding domain-containing protein n=1 Tax=Rhodocytophaga aerolata TaxID=455078 RepID=A0ABT8R6K2_9BACT|nr:LytTR family DNA-binding domain-containing protein [Rhodocytophaga aerolata]MDO1447736.1 LytTR family DNA-binding domain-containing protein [Rhodocytophaga aerolata]